MVPKKQVSAIVCERFEVQARPPALEQVCSRSAVALQVFSWLALALEQACLALQVFSRLALALEQACLALQVSSWLALALEQAFSTSAVALQVSSWLALEPSRAPQLLRSASR